MTNAFGATAISGGNVTKDGDDVISARGVCWSTDHNPTIEDNKTVDGTGTGEFISTLTGLTPEVTYYLRAYATNFAGTAYGEEISFSTIQPVLPTISHLLLQNLEVMLLWMEERLSQPEGFAGLLQRNLL